MNEPILGAATAAILISLGGLAVGILAAWLIFIFDKPLDIIYSFILKIARVLRLA